MMPNNPHRMLVCDDHADPSVLLGMGGPKGFAFRSAPPSPSMPRRPRLSRHGRLPSNKEMAHRHGLAYHAPTAFRLAVAQAVRQNNRAHHRALRGLRAVRTGASCQNPTRARAPSQRLKPVMGYLDANLRVLGPSFNSHRLPPSKMLRKSLQGALAIQCPQGQVIARFPRTPRRSLSLPSMNSGLGTSSALMLLFTAPFVARSS